MSDSDSVTRQRFGKDFQVLPHSAVSPPCTLQPGKLSTLATRLSPLAVLVRRASREFHVGTYISEGGGQPVDLAGFLIEPTVNAGRSCLCAKNGSSCMYIPNTYIAAGCSDLGVVVWAETPGTFWGGGEGLGAGCGPNPLKSIRSGSGGLLLLYKSNNQPLVDILETVTQPVLRERQSSTFQGSYIILISCVHVVNGSLSWCHGWTSRRRTSRSFRIHVSGEVAHQSSIRAMFEKPQSSKIPSWPPCFASHFLTRVLNRSPIYLLQPPFFPACPAFDEDHQGTSRASPISPGSLVMALPCCLRGSREGGHVAW